MLEERDIQVRGYQLRLPLDLLLVASANPEDYTNRGRIITPLKDRFGAEIRTHYPLDLDLEIDADPAGGGAGRRRCPTTCSRCSPGSPAAVRESPAVDAALRCLGPVRDRGGRDRRRVRAAPRPACSARREPVARIGDTVSVTSTLRGKVEFESGEEGRETEVLAHLLRTATAETFRARLAGLDLSGFTDLVAEGDIIETGELVARRRAAARRSAPCPGWPRCSTGSASATRRPAGEAAAGVEFVLEGLHLTRRLAKELTDDGRTALRELSSDAATGSGTARGAAGPTRSPRRTTCGPPSTQVGERGAGRRQPARRAARPAAPRPARTAAASTTCWPGPGGCAARRCAAATSTAR